MGARKRLRSEQSKEERKSQYMAKLNNCPTSPRKMRLVADMIRGEKVELALHMLEHSPQQAAGRMRKLLLSAIANWQVKNQGVRLEDSHLFIEQVMVDGGRMLKRVQPAPQGRAYRVRKRSNHVTLFLGSRGIEKEIQS
jgi:large subunit ribosomal protein L22